MNAKEITVRNIEANGYRVGKSVRGKGLELFQGDTCVGYTWSAAANPDFLKKLTKTLEDKNLDIEQLYVQEIWIKEGGATKHYSFDHDVKISQQRFDLKKMIATKFESVTEIDIYATLNEIVGYFPISAYTSSLDSQKEMLKDLLKFEGKTLYADEISEYSDELDYSADGIIDFQRYGDDEYWNGDYHLIHGSTSHNEDTDTCGYLNGRMSNLNDIVLSDFWDYNFDELTSYLDELDPDDKICVYARKGKDWYIGYTYESDEISIAYINEDRKEEEETYYSYYFKEDSKLIEKITEVLQSQKDSLEMKSFIYNEFGENQTIASNDVIEFLYEEPDDLRTEIIDSITNWSIDSISEEFTKEYYCILGEKIKVDNDFTVKLTFTPSQFGRNPKTSTSVQSYNQLKLLKRLEKRFAYKLVYTSLPGSEIKAWAISKGNEEYHFGIIDTIREDINEERSIKDFIREALGALEKRRIEKMSQQELFDKASHIFIGFEDSLKSGNCEFGTKQFIAKHHIDTSRIGGIRGDVLLDMEFNNFTKRAVNQAIISHGMVS